MKQSYDILDMKFKIQRFRAGENLSEPENWSLEIFESRDKNKTTI